MKYLILSTWLCLSLQVALAQNDKPAQPINSGNEPPATSLEFLSPEKEYQLGKNDNKEIIATMRMSEKARFLVGMGMRLPVELVPPSADPNQKQPADAQSPVIGSTDDKVLGAAGTSADFLRFGIPKVVFADGPAGIRIAPDRPNDKKTYYATAFPIGTLLASSWDVDLVKKTGVAMGNEVKEYGVDVLLGPGMNIHRNPLGGRNFEYYSEDPLLTGKIASAMVQGIQSNGVGTSIKHFAVNNFETNRNTVNANVSERALREIYLKGFEICVKEAQPWTIMSSYNKVNGTYTSQSGDLLKKILRDDWHYKGLVLTDWFGGDNAVEQMKAGNELLMPGTPKQLNDIANAVKNGNLEETVLDENVDVMLNFIKKTPSFHAYPYSNQPNLKANAEVARTVATEGIILLKNDKKTLPISNKKSVAVFGNFSYDLISGGTGSGDVNEAYTISLTEGLENAGLKLDQNLKSTYSSYLKAEKAKQTKKPSFFEPSLVIPELSLNKDAIQKASKNDFAILTIGRSSGEFFDRKETEYTLDAIELALIRDVSSVFHAKGKKVIVILNVGGPVDVASWRDAVDAILLPWLPGQEAGNAIADILTGKVNPSGKLATTFAVKYADEPTATNFIGKEYGDAINLGFAIVHPAEIEYTEGIYVGYRGFDKKGTTPAYEFGFGLSYTDFKYSDLTVENIPYKEDMLVTVTVKNTGKVAGKEVVQLYLSAPAKTMDKPMQELKGFAKTNLLKPNESQTISFELSPRDLASFDENQSAWIVDAGTYTVKIGASSRNILLKKDFTFKASLVVEKVTKALQMRH